MQKSSLSFRYGFDLGQNLLLKKIQHASLNRQIKKKVGLKLWRILFKGYRYGVDSEQVTITAPNERIAGIIAKRYKMPLEKFFATRIQIERET